MTWAGAIAAGAIAMATPVAAQDARWWCATDGSERLSFEGTSIQFNEHTICTADSVVAMTSDTGDMWSGAVSCQNIYVTGEDANGVLQTTAVPLDTPTWLSLVGAADGTLFLRVTPDDPGRTYLLC